MNKQIITPVVFTALSYVDQISSVKSELVKPDLPASQPNEAAKLRSKLGGRFGIRLESTGSRASELTTLIIMQTLDVSPDNPCLVTFDQHILNPFTGSGQFDLMERDAGNGVDVLDAESGSPVTIATKDGVRGE